MLKFLIGVFFLIIEIEIVLLLFRLLERDYSRREDRKNEEKKRGRAAPGPARSGAQREESPPPAAPARDIDVPLEEPAVSLPDIGFQKPAAGAKDAAEPPREPARPGIRLGVVREEDLKKYGRSVDIVAKENGELRVTDTKGRRVSVVPCAEELTERIFGYSAVGLCFEPSQPIEGGPKYRVLNTQPATLRREGQVYRLEEQGRLEIERMH